MLELTHQKNEMIAQLLMIYAQRHRERMGSQRGSPMDVDHTSGG